MFAFSHSLQSHRLLLRFLAASAATVPGLAVFDATRSWEWAALAALAVVSVFGAVITNGQLGPGFRRRTLVWVALPAVAAGAYLVASTGGMSAGRGLVAALVVGYVAQLLVGAALLGGFRAAADDGASARSRVQRLRLARRRLALRAGYAIAAAFVGVVVAVYTSWATHLWPAAILAGSAIAFVVDDLAGVGLRSRRLPGRRGVALCLAVRLVAAVASLMLGVVGVVLAVALQPYTPMLFGVALVVVAIRLGLSAWRPFGFGLGSLVGVAAAAVLVSQLTVSTTPILDAAGRAVPGSIATIERVTLGGVEQSIVIRGRSIDNPVLLVLSGGPGPTQLAWHRQYLTGLEDSFAVVYWEQRGSGKSGGLALADWDRMTAEQYTADGLELTEYLRERFAQPRIYVVGQSWGTMLGVWMVQQRPEWFAAYVGIGQMTNPVEDDRLIYEYVIDRARQEGDTTFVRALEAQGPPPYEGFIATTKYGQLFGRSKDYETALVAASKPDPIAPLVGMTETPEYGLAETVGAYLNGAITFARVYDQLDWVDLDRQVTRLDVPVYLAEGRWDLNAMPALAERWFDNLQAPSKALVWFEHSGHNPEHEEPAAFVDFMVNKVRAETRQ